MKRLAKGKFMDFVVSLPEDGDVAGMKQMLSDFPQHRDELLFGIRDGVSDGKYSVWRYTTWLCQFPKYAVKARPVLTWLLTQGHKPDIWSAIAFDDETALNKILIDAPEKSRAVHPLFDETALSIASLKLRPILLQYGADDGSITTAIFLGELDRARTMINAAPEILADPEIGPNLLYEAVTSGLDEFACELITHGVDTDIHDGDYSLISMAATHGNPKATKALLEAGADPNQRDGRFTPISMCISRSTAKPDIVRDVVANLIAGGARVGKRAKLEGKTWLQWCELKGLDETAELLKLAMANRDG